MAWPRDARRGAKLPRLQQKGPGSGAAGSGVGHGVSGGLGSQSHPDRPPRVIMWPGPECPDMLRSPPAEGRKGRGGVSGISRSRSLPRPAPAAGRPDLASACGPAPSGPRRPAPARRARPPSCGRARPTRGGPCGRADKQPGSRGGARGADGHRDPRPRGDLPRRRRQPPALAHALVGAVAPTFSGVTAVALGAPVALGVVLRAGQQGERAGGRGDPPPLHPCSRGSPAPHGRPSWTWILPSCGWVDTPPQ